MQNKCLIYVIEMETKQKMMRHTRNKTTRSQCYNLAFPIRLTNNITYIIGFRFLLCRLKCILFSNGETKKFERNALCTVHVHVRRLGFTYGPRRWK